MVNHQRNLFDAAPAAIVLPTFPAEVTIQERFEQFHAMNPHVYTHIVAIARELRRRGFRRIGIGMIFERLRWLHALATQGDDFKLNNNFRSRYARLIMDAEADLADAFEVRRLRAQ